MVALARRSFAPVSALRRAILVYWKILAAKRFKVSGLSSVIPASCMACFTGSNS
jgi:hypothetical protein